MTLPLIRTVYACGHDQIWEASPFHQDGDPTTEHSPEICGACQPPCLNCRDCSTPLTAAEREHGGGWCSVCFEVECARYEE